MKTEKKVIRMLKGKKINNNMDNKTFRDTKKGLIRF